MCFDASHNIYINIMLIVHNFKYLLSQNNFEKPVA